MKKQILNLGKALNKAEQKQINGGNHAVFTHAGDPCFDRMEGRAPGGCPCAENTDCASSTCSSNGVCY